MRERGKEGRERAGKKSQRHRIDDVHVGSRYHDRGDGDSRPLRKIEPHLIPPLYAETIAGDRAQPKQMLKKGLMTVLAQGLTPNLRKDCAPRSRLPGAVP